MTYNPLQKIPELGQSIWMDYLRRGLLESGELGRLIDNDELRGITSNPQIFWKAIDGSDDYTSAIHALAEQGKSKEEIYRTLTVEDVQAAADVFRPLYENLNGGDGFVSLEVNPHLARDVDGTIKEAKELWQALDRPNVFIKVPATREGLTCIRRLIADGINVNVTLLFGLDRYREVVDAYISGLEDRLKNGEAIDKINSVASFFLSRIDVKLDPELEKTRDIGGQHSAMASDIHGEIAIASAKIAYQICKELFATDRFRKLEEKGARPQRVLWASTSTKNPDYSDIKYVEALIGPSTINTLPQETINAYRDHGHPEVRLENDVEKSYEIMEKLKTVGVDIDKVTSELIEEGIDKFNKPYDETMESLTKKMKESEEQQVDSLEFRPRDLKLTVADRIKILEDMAFSERIWKKDTTLWSDNDSTQSQIANSLGWLHVAEKMLANVPDLRRFTSEIRSEDFRHVVHLGMGGSSLAPMVFQRTFQKGKDGLPLTVLDTTHPRTIKHIAGRIPIEDTLFIVASKSGGTAETLCYMEYFYEQVQRVRGDKAGRNFVVITDPGSRLVEVAHKRGFRKTFLNYADIGGRYSALSYFGFVPATLMGINVEELLERAVRMAHSSQCRTKGAANPCVELGATLGELANQGRNKLTFIASDTISSIGMWLEQLLAESTGKNGKGILPVADEQLGDPANYDKDRVFVYFELQDKKYDETLAKLDKLADAGHPVIIIRLADKYDLGQEMMRWELATATAGAVLAINPFDQPNVQESKDNTGKLLQVVRTGGSLPLPQEAIDPDDLGILLEAAQEDLQERISEFLSHTNDGDYVAIQAYIPEDEETDQALQEMRIDLRNRLRVATTIGYGPRFLHSTGQFHKGGPNTGLFIQLVGGVEQDLDIPNRNFSFATLMYAQALGDLTALRKHNRRVIRIDLGRDVLSGLKRMNELLRQPVHQ